ncbi:unnamed protein product [Laminaria digitata]
MIPFRICSVSRSLSTDAYTAMNTKSRHTRGTQQRPAPALCFHASCVHCAALIY